MKTKSAKMSRWTVALMAFMGIWGFANILNGFYYFHGTHSLFFWILVFALYFAPYAFMVGELGSAFKDCGGGVSDWIANTFGPRLGFLAGWTYFVVHIPYLVTKSNTVVIGVSWVIFQNSFISQLDVKLFALCGIAVFLLSYFLARRGISTLGKLSSIAGTASLIMSLLFIVLIAGWVITSGEGRATLSSFDASDFMPVFGWEVLLNYGVLLFAVGGIEKIAPYVNQTKEVRDFSRGIVLSVAMVSVCALLGTVAMGLMIDSDNIPDDFLTNGAYYAFQLLGEKLGLGNILVIIYAAVFSFQTLSLIVLSIDAPIRTFLSDSNRQYVSSWFYKTSNTGVFVNAYRIVLVAVLLLLTIPAFGIPDVDDLFEWLIKMSSVIMPLRYLWVFAAYIGLKRIAERFAPEYTFTKNKHLGIAFGCWCAGITATACISGVVAKTAFETTLNIVLPIVLIGAGVLLIIRSERRRAKGLMK